MNHSQAAKSEMLELIGKLQCHAQAGSEMIKWIIEEIHSRQLASTKQAARDALADLTVAIANKMENETG